MKKMIIIILMLVVVSIGVIGFDTLTKEQALEVYNNQTSQDVTISNITYTSDKVCTIGEQDKDERGILKETVIVCEVCFDYLINNEVQNSCIFLKEGNDLKEDEKVVEEFVLTSTKEATLIEKVEYVEREMKDITKDIGLKEVD